MNYDFSEIEKAIVELQTALPVWHRFTWAITPDEDPEKITFVVGSSKETCFKDSLPVVASQMLRPYTQPEQNHLLENILYSEVIF